MAKCLFPETTGQESSKPATSGTRSSSDMRNAFGALFQGDLAPLRPRAQSTPDMTVAVNPALVQSFFSQVWLGTTTPLSYAGGNSGSVSAPSSNPRIDLLTIDSSGTLAWTTGSEGASPTAPDCPAGKMPICYIYCKTTMTKIVNYEDKDANPNEGYIYKDIRPFLNMGGATVDNFTIELNASGQVKLKDRIELNIMLLAFKLAVQDGLVKYNMVDGFMDEFEDESGVDTGGSTNEYYDSTNDLYRPTANDPTGGTITYSGGKTIHTFKLADSGTNFVVPAGASGTVDVLIVAGGGGGGGAQSGSYYAGGGGAGGVIQLSDEAVSAGNYAIVVGAGGAGGASNSQGSDGGNSSAFSNTAIGGGGGGCQSAGTGRNGGSGGGGASSGAGGSPTSGQGYAGGTGHAAYAAGGGGAGAVGGAGSASPPYGGYGGAGIQSSISGASTWYAAGGGGSPGDGTSTNSIGGKGGVNNGAGGVATQGADDTGSGGGGGQLQSSSVVGGDGGNGIVIISYDTGSLGGTYNDMTLVSNAITAEAEPANARIVLYEEDVDSITVNTDIKAYVSIDGGSNYDQVTLTDEGDYDSGKRILTGIVDVSARTGTSVKWKVTTHNSKGLKLHAVGGTWD